MRRLELCVALLCLVAGASAQIYCATVNSYTGSYCTVYAYAGNYLFASTCANKIQGACAYGDTVLTITGPTAGTQWAYDDDCGSNCPANIFASDSQYGTGATTGYVSTTGYYTITGRCISSAACNAAMYYTYSASSVRPTVSFTATCSAPTATCSGLGCSSCLLTSGCGWCPYSSSSTTSGYCQTSTSSCSSTGFNYIGGSTSICYSSTTPNGSGGSGSTTTDAGWAAPAALTAVSCIIMISTTAVYLSMLCTDCGGCGCAPSPEQRRLPSLLDSPVGPMHWHTFALLVLVPIAALLIFVALAVDGYDQFSTDHTILLGAFAIHQKGTTLESYNTLCASHSGPVTTTDRACPSFRIAGAMSFIAMIAALLALIFGLIKFAMSKPYEAAGKGAFAGGKPFLPIVFVRMVQIFYSLIVGATVLWLVGGHASFLWLQHVNGSGGSTTIQLAASWGLMVAAVVLSIPAAMIARRESLRGEQKPAASPTNAAQGLVPGASSSSPMGASKPYVPPQPMQQPGVNMGFGQPAPVYGQQPIYGAPQQQQPPGGMGLTGYAPQYGAPQQQQPVVVMGAAPVVMMNAPPPAYSAAPPQRVPVVPPAGLALPPGAILYSNGDVCDASGNLLGVVPGMQAQPVAPVVINSQPMISSGTA